jgi:rod shape determining protein RodA
VGALSQLDYVPVLETDFIFVAIAESFGFLGCFIILVIYAALILRLFYLARTVNDKFGSLIIYGFMFMLLFHVFENVGMTIGIMPITGIPLPFISKGGSNMITNMAGIGLVLSVCYYGRDTERDTL